MTKSANTALNELEAVAADLLEAGQLVELETLLDRARIDSKAQEDRNFESVLMCYYEEAGAYEKAVDAARRYCNTDDNGSKWERVSKRIALARLLCKAAAFEEAFHYVGELSREPFVLENYEAGLARQFVMAAIELALNPLADTGLRQSALALANEHLNAGCSVTVVLLDAMVKAATGLGAVEIARTFAVRLETLKREQQLARE